MNLSPPLYYRVLCALAAPVLVLGCGSDLADDPLFNDQQASVQRMDEELRTLRGQVEELNRVMSDLVTELEGFKGAPLSGMETGQRIEQRVEVLETAIRQSNQTLSELRSRLDERPAADTTRTARLAPTNGGERPAQVRATPKPTPTPTPKPLGFYHTVRSGETLSSIAAQHGVSADALRKSNHIPEGREPFPGQQIYVMK
jgi:LysM repeat protein